MTPPSSTSSTPSTGRSTSPTSSISSASSASTKSPISSSKADLSYLPSPFYPPTLAKQEGLTSEFGPIEPLPEEYPQLPKDTSLTVDEKGKGTPDEWIIREDKLVRLTGKYPFNCEAPLPDLFNAGFLTPMSLFYVRNHGIVPRVTREDALSWTVEVSGMVSNPLTLSLADLSDPSQFTAVTLPITLVCAGNRRKEQNVVRKSLGFSWGPAGLSTALFTGVYLADVLEKVAVRNEGKWGDEGFRRAMHVIFEGSEDLPNGKYGTSQLLRWCKDRGKGMMLAWAMNGEALEPDHGYPLRLVVPGQIGGRSVKWLKKVIVSDMESQHHLHFWDNKVLPTTLMPEQARSEKHWWYDPRYIINDLNTNSAIARPAHDESLVVKPSATYKLEGYAYAGGGRRVDRIEISLDAGESWILCNITYPEDKFRSRPFKGKVWGEIDMTERDECFCWAFWSLEVELEKLGEASSVAVRAGDHGLNLQGKTMYWNPTGMMNNHWFRVAIHKTKSESGELTLRFEQPTQPGLLPGGWMERMKEDGDDIINPVFGDPPSDEDVEIKELSKAKAKKPQVSMVKEGVNRKITMAEVQEHNKESEPWFIVHGEVYDGTDFLSKHPGGAESITLVAGEDASDDFMAIHSIDAKRQLADYHIGTLIGSSAPTADAPVSSEPDPVFLHKTKWKAAKLTKISKINHDSRIYTFALEFPEQELGLPTGQHVYCRLRRKVSPGDAEAKSVEVVEGELVQRAYTPVSPDDAKGTLDMLIKVYHRTPEFPEGGKMTLGFEELEIGESIEFKGPLGSFIWAGNGIAKWRGVQRKAKNLGLICAGSGITPIIQVLRGVIRDKSDTTTQLWVINANKTEADILLREELEQLCEEVGPERMRHHMVLSKAPEDWKFSKGRVNLDMMKAHLPPQSEDSLILICGPDPLIEAVVKPGLTELGWDVPSQLVVF